MPRVELLQDLPGDGPVALVERRAGRHLLGGADLGGGGAGERGSGRQREARSPALPSLPFSHSPNARQPLDPPHRRRHRHMARLIDVAVGDGDRQRLRAQTLAAAGGAGPAGHVALQLAPDVVGCGLPIAALQVGDHALVVGLEAAVVALVIDITDRDGVALFAAVQDDVHLVFAQLADRHVERDVVVLADRLQHGVVDRLRVAVPRPDCAVRRGSCSCRARSDRRRTPSGCRGRCRSGRRRAGC